MKKCKHDILHKTYDSILQLLTFNMYSDLLNI